jgi:hypothetical protein
MKLTVELDDFWVNEDSGAEDIERELKDYIISEVTAKIYRKIAAQVNTQITESVGALVEKKLSATIDSEIASCIDGGTIRTSNKGEVKIVDHVKDMFLNNRGWSAPDRAMDRICKDFAIELKNQYNNAFANKVVKSIKEQGLLKDEVVQILLGDS